MQIITHVEFTNKLEPILRQVFVNDNPFIAPLNDRVEARAIVYPCSAGYWIEPPLTDAIITAASNLGDNGCYISIFWRPQNEPWHWYIPFDEFIEVYVEESEKFAEYQFSQQATFSESVIYSPRGKWGIILSHEFHGVIGGPAEFIEDIRSVVPFFDKQVYAFLERLRYFKQTYRSELVTLDWLPELLTNVYGKKVAEKILRETSLIEKKNDTSSLPIPTLVSAEELLSEMEANHINKIEYLILCSVLEFPANLMNVGLDWGIPSSLVAIAAHRLFENGDILATVTTGDISFPYNREESVEKTDKIAGVVLTMSEIEANLMGKFEAKYYLTPQGGANWETIAHPDWQQYLKWSSVPGSTESTIISQDREAIEQLLQLAGYLEGKAPIPKTVIWELLEPWEATYWKILPHASKVCYQSQAVDNSNCASPEFSEQSEKAYKWYGEIREWYRKP